MSKKPINKKTLLLIEKQNKISMNSGICFILSVGYTQVPKSVFFFFFFFFSVAGLVVIIIVVVNLSIEKKKSSEITCPSLTQIGPS